MLGQSQYTIKSRKSFMKTQKKQKIPSGFQIVSFDVASLFTNAPLKDIFTVIITRIYDKKEINTKIPKKELLHICTKNTHFILNSKTYVQIDSVAMESRLGPVLANNFVVDLKQNYYYYSYII